MKKVMRVWSALMCVITVHGSLHGGNTVATPSHTVQVDSIHQQIGNPYSWILDHPSFPGYIKTAGQDQLENLCALEIAPSDSKKAQRSITRIQSIAHAELRARFAPVTKGRLISNEDDTADGQQDESRSDDYEFLVVCSCIWP